MSGKYYNVGDFIAEKKTGKFFRITGIILDENKGLRYNIVPIHFEREYSQIIDVNEINKFEKV